MQTLVFHHGIVSVCVRVFTYPDPSQLGYAGCHYYGLTIVILCDVPLRARTLPRQAFVVSFAHAASSRYR
jgi:hypothetical protein